MCNTGFGFGYFIGNFAAWIFRPIPRKVQRTFLSINPHGAWRHKNGIMAQYYPPTQFSPKRELLAHTTDVETAEYLQRWEAKQRAENETISDTFRDALRKKDAAKYGAFLRDPTQIEWRGQMSVERFMSAYLSGIVEPNASVLLVSDGSGKTHIDARNVAMYISKMCDFERSRILSHTVATIARRVYKVTRL